MEIPQIPPSQEMSSSPEITLTSEAEASIANETTEETTGTVNKNKNTTFHGYSSRGTKQLGNVQTDILLECLGLSHTWTCPYDEEASTAFSPVLTAYNPPNAPHHHRWWVFK